MKFGKLELHLISDGHLWMDGGAMFGVVPKTLWQREMPPDRQNRIRLALNCLLIQTGEANILIDTGCGFKYSKKEIQIYNLDNKTNLLDELAQVSLDPEDIDVVINTHLHFDHCGGNTIYKNGEIVPTFPQAEYWISRLEYEDAQQPNERTKATYYPHNWEPVEESNLLNIFDGEPEVAPGVQLVHTPGHTAGHYSVKIESEGQVMFFIADLCPTTAHIRLPWIMSYDLFPITTLKVRRQIYDQAIQEKWLLFFEHDPEIFLGYLSKKEEEYVLKSEPWRT
ncbi:MAG: MBL fold metallo-hydrolase [Acidobacteriota bacterium]|nr:MBL fold metallo-hydrolase [Acidobacteriota bacterium]